MFFLGVGRACAGAVRPAQHSRFYVTEALDQTGVHALRFDGGTDAYAPYTNMEPILLVGAVAGLAFYPVAFAGGGVPLFGMPLLLGPVLLVGWRLFRKARLEGQRQYGADSRPIGAD